MYPSILLPGQKLQHRTNLVRGFAHITLPPLQSRIKSMGTDERLRVGLTACFRCDATTWRWFDVSIHAKSPQKPPCFGIQPYDVLGWSQFEDALQGDVNYPDRVKLVIPELFDGRPVSVFQIPQSRCTDFPDLFIYLENYPSR